MYLDSHQVNIEAILVSSVRYKDQVVKEEDMSWLLLQSTTTIPNSTKEERVLYSKYMDVCVRVWGRLMLHAPHIHVLLHIAVPNYVHVLRVCYYA